MSRPKLNIFLFDKFDKEGFVIKSIKADYDKEHDCYYVDVDTIYKKIYKNMLMSLCHLCFEKYGVTYYGSNIFLEKTKNKISIKLVFETTKHSQFYKEESINNFFNTVKLSNYPFTKHREIYELHKLCHKNLIKSVYLAGVYVEKNNQRMYFNSGIIEKKGRYSLIKLQDHTYNVITLFETKNNEDEDEDEE